MRMGSQTVRGSVPGSGVWFGGFGSFYRAGSLRFRIWLCVG